MFICLLSFSFYSAKILVAKCEIELLVLSLSNDLCSSNVLLTFSSIIVSLASTASSLLLTLCNFIIFIKQIGPWSTTVYRKILFYCFSYLAYYTYSSLHSMFPLTAPLTYNTIIICFLIIGLTSLRVSRPLLFHLFSAFLVGFFCPVLYA